MSRSSLVVLVPTLDGRPQRACEDGLRELERRGVTVRRVGGHSAIDFARSLLATRALADGFDELMWIDDDVVFDPSDVFRLADSGEALIAGVYPKKGKRELALHVTPGTTSFTFGPAGGHVEVRYAAAGFLYTHRRLYEAMAPELPVCNERFGERVVPYFLPFVVETPERGTWYLAEDYAFCERARRAGHRVHGRHAHSPLPRRLLRVQLGGRRRRPEAVRKLRVPLRIGANEPMASGLRELLPKQKGEIDADGRVVRRRPPSALVVGAAPRGRLQGGRCRCG